MDTPVMELVLAFLCVCLVLLARIRIEATRGAVNSNVSPKLTYQGFPSVCVKKRDSGIV